MCRTQPQASRPLGLLVAGQVKNYVPVTDEMLRNPDPGDWLMIRRNYQAHSYSPLNSITTANVKDLRLEWVWAMNDGGANEPTPIVHNGIIYLANTSNTVQALDGADGRSDLGESHRSQRHAQRTALPAASASIRTRCSSPRPMRSFTRSMRAAARSSGDTVIADSKKGYGNTSGPLVIHGKVVQGLTGCSQFRPEGCFISAYDAETGKQLWKFQTVPREGELGADTWGSIPNLLRAGGETWITGSYDPDLNQTYWGVAQAKPWMRASRGASAATRRCSPARRSR